MAPLYLSVSISRFLSLSRSNILSIDYLGKIVLCIIRYLLRGFIIYKKLITKRYAPYSATRQTLGSSFVLRSPPRCSSLARVQDPLPFPSKYPGKQVLSEFSQNNRVQPRRWIFLRFAGRTLPSCSVSNCPISREPMANLYSAIVDAGESH